MKPEVLLHRLRKRQMKQATGWQGAAACLLLQTRALDFVPL
jgi:hypothetical protein